jgi:hypothetical protein
MKLLSPSLVELHALLLRQTAEAVVSMLASYLDPAM